MVHIEYGVMLLRGSRAHVGNHRAVSARMCMSVISRLASGTSLQTDGRSVTDNIPVRMSAGR